MIRRIFSAGGVWPKSGRGGQIGQLVPLKDGEGILFSVLFDLQIVSDEETNQLRLLVETFYTAKVLI